MTIFDYINDILKFKTGALPLDSYTPYLINRWLSFINPHLAQFVNEFNDKTFLEDKEMHYKAMISTLPKIRNIPKINYIKKTKIETVEEDNRILILANSMEISKREAKELLQIQ